MICRSIKSSASAWGSLTPGHPERNLTPGVEATTGPLGQGLGNAVGMAMAEAHLAALFNRPGYEIVNHRTYVIASDGYMMEGVQSEACSLAGDLKLGKLIVLYDDNGITLSGTTSIAFREDVGARFAAYGWHVQHIGDGTSTTESRALSSEPAGPGSPACSTRSCRGRPSRSS